MRLLPRVQNVTMMFLNPLWIVGFALLNMFCCVTSKYQSHFTNAPQLLLANGNNDECEIVLNTFALATANYTFCVISAARPIKLCQNCVEKYKFVLKEHNDILNLNIEGGGACKEKLINLDRLQVVEAGFDYVTGLWDRANCNSCFKLDENNEPTNELNDNTKEILRLSNATNECINQHRNDSYSTLFDPQVCVECLSNYQELNSGYESLKAQGFCMDIVDMMNSTRSMWSTDLGCCLDRKKPEWLFVVSSIVVTCLPFVFYLASFILVARKEHTVFKQRRLPEAFSSTATISSVVDGN